ncbi:MAG: indolepyruvate ferredoxin oxidoreductase subunit alpha [Pseudomonadales bacterium]|jgi:indolepyruvate ferredoxin oxidoreductase alpha subunit|nr:indolepyruvate ferredoxin oxidoreductase subunit alpha [Gammaproteobacteria bacterium]MBP6051902.1 indolepyruvate ferredoxin oxidoreductase subunit alpha [Pseudomonadales bacterium]MBK6581878.1 indolepyruvate ferredoxin oxidoreductase subunit alpha [Gammaproteobacteria bacterium]MBK7169416.1 indolepyruvate ferredoxin oxidoreductase subunit alpha [Gammaproteobacteria bacterium]MBK7520713.1 indolepyruvate ferredoxin oxidoreductase subunit alpha [Gammaproteobacteria bacterium]
MSQLAETGTWSKPVANDLAPENRQSSRPMMGNEAIARGAWEAGVKIAAAYPGTPSTEILENLARYPASDLHAQWSTNEKVALDVAIGGSFAGVRSMTAMKHVGLNVASDSLMSQTYIGVNGALVLVVCDDPGIHSSQNEQDTRCFGQLAMVPVLEPSDAQEALDFTRLAFDLSERFDSPVIVRSTTRLSHTRSLVRTGERREHAGKGFLELPGKNVMIPGHARIRHRALLERERQLQDYFETSELIRWEPGSAEIGVVTLSTAYTYVKEVLPEASVLKLGVSYPLPEARIREFCASVKRVIVVEELEPVIENQLKVMGLAVEGKTLFPRAGEFSIEVVLDGCEAGGLLPPRPKPELIEMAAMTRPPLLCAGCPHTTAFMALRALDSRVSGDIGCYTLAAVEPLKAIDTSVAMGSSIANATGIALSGTETRPVVATIGDSTFLHAGIPPLINAVYNNANITVVLLDNHITAMTGGQDHPGTGRNLRGEPTHKVDYEALIKAIGVKWLRKIDAYNMGSVYQSLRESTQYKGVSVIILDRPCVLDPVKLKGPAFQVKAENCTGCQACMNLGCPAISWSDEMYEGHHKVKIDEAACIGCSLCAQVGSTNCIQPADAGQLQ